MPEAGGTYRRCVRFVLMFHICCVILPSGPGAPSPSTAQKTASSQLTSEQIAEPAMAGCAEGGGSGEAMAGAKQRQKMSLRELQEHIHEAAYRRLADDGDGDDTAWMHMALNDPGDGSEEL